MDIGQRIKDLRMSEGLSQNALAEKAGISQSHLRRVEQGLSDMTINHLVILCDALGLTIQDFFGNNPRGDELSVALSTLTPKQKAKLCEFIKTLK